jgi:hypothetical protein
MYVPNAISYSPSSFNYLGIQNSAITTAYDAGDSVGKQERNSMATRPTTCRETTVYDSHFVKISKELVHK